MKAKFGLAGLLAALVVAGLPGLSEAGWCSALTTGLHVTTPSERAAVATKATASDASEDSVFKLTCFSCGGGGSSSFYGGSSSFYGNSASWYPSTSWYPGSSWGWGTSFYPSTSFSPTWSSCSPCNSCSPCSCISRCSCYPGWW